MTKRQSKRSIFYVNVQTATDYRALAYLRFLE